MAAEQTSQKVRQQGREVEKVRKERTWKKGAKEVRGEVKVKKKVLWIGEKV